MVSVVVPVRNEVGSLDRAVRSILCQTHQDLEILLVDDFSTDGSSEAILKWQSLDERVRALRVSSDNPQRRSRDGQDVDAGYRARNVGLDKALGEWVTFQDADDWSLLNRLEVQLQIAEDFNVSHVVTSYFANCELSSYRYLDFRKLLKDRGYPGIEKFSSSELSSLAEQERGIASKALGDAFWRVIPFTAKSSRALRALFFANCLPFPGAANSPLVRSEMARNMFFRSLNERRWPTLRGRGADRDFNFALAHKYKNSLFLDIPLYHWTVPRDLPYDSGWLKYLTDTSDCELSQNHLDV